MRAYVCKSTHFFSIVQTISVILFYLEENQKIIA